MYYRVTLVQRVKKEVEAATPEEALTAAMSQAQQTNATFEPANWQIKEIEQ